jgi:hypothetical protein
MSCNDFGQPELERSAAAPSRAAWWIAWAVALIVHGFAGLVLLGMLGALAPKFTELFVRLERQQGGLPALLTSRPSTFWPGCRAEAGGFFGCGSAWC